MFTMKICFMVVIMGTLMNGAASHGDGQPNNRGHCFRESADCHCGAADANRRVKEEKSPQPRFNHSFCARAPTDSRCQPDELLQSLIQFRNIFLCVMPTGWPLLKYADYGCYCGLGGSGTPVDELDRCCQVHDQCYSDAQQHSACTSFWDSPYFVYYSWECDTTNKKATCTTNLPDYFRIDQDWTRTLLTGHCRGKNDECDMFICECDRKAAECFDKAEWNKKYWHLDSDKCK